MDSAHQEDRGPQFLAIFGTGAAIASMLVFLRLWTLALISLSCMGRSVHYGLGKHMASLQPEQASSALKLLWISFCIIPCSEATAKFSITIMLMRITTSPRWRRFFISLIAATVMITVAKFFGIIFSCWPIERLWNVGGATAVGHCNVTERTAIIYIQGVMAAGYDVLLATSPVLLLWKVQISRYEKASLCGLFALGFFTSAAGIVRTVYTYESTDTTDPTYDVLDFLIWKTIELPMSIIVGCLPTLRPLITHFRRHSYHKQNDVYPLNEEAMGRNIRKTVTIDMDVTNPSAGDVAVLRPSAWDVEA